MIANITLLFTPAARLILGIYFLLPGIMKLTDYQGTADYMASHGMIFIPFFLILTAIIQIGGSFALIAGYKTQLVAFVFAGLTLVISLVLHDFWTMEPSLQTAHETQNFFKNMGIMGGLLALSGHGGGAFSLDNRNKRSG
ncbi:MAG: DoxX family protein [Pseudomonadales bacterium]|nr:DoxX family protein [Pseudomonadales bacterium]